jgi:predicted ferric reductase
MAELRRWGYPAIFLLAAVPFIIWLLMQPLSTRFPSLGTALTSLGQLSSLTGLVIFSITFVLNTRLEFLEDFFGGQDRVYQAHHTIGTIAFALLVMHPLLLSYKYLQISLKSAITFLIPGADFAINFGIYALLVMEILLIITFYIRLKYNKWKFTHEFLGMAFLLASLHIFFISSDISRSVALRFYILAFVAIGLLAFFYRTMFGRLLVKKYGYTVAKVLNLDSGITEISLKPSKEKLKHKAGQFIFISFKSKSIPDEPHPFTISSFPEEQNIRLSIKASGDYTQNIKNLNMGDPAFVEGPFGRFLSKSENEQVWIAGGIGITPFLSMARSFRDLQKHVWLHYCTKNEKEAVFLKELQGLSAANPNFTVITHFSDTQGFVNAEMINTQTHLKGKEILLCGPPPMMNSLRKGFINLKVSISSIHLEEFSLR